VIKSDAKPPAPDIVVLNMNLDNAIPFGDSDERALLKPLPVARASAPAIAT